MGVDWGFAGQVGGMGFGMVFFLLVILAIIVWFTGLMLNRFSTEKSKDAEKKNIKEGA